MAAANLRRENLVLIMFCCFQATLAAWKPALPFVLHNATVYTLVPSAPYASALCARDGRIEAVGSDAAVLGSACAASAGSRVVDLRGAAVVPGLTDSHAHLLMDAARRTRADLLAAGSALEAAQAALAFSKSHPGLVRASGWVQGFGWDQTRWPGGAFPSRADLDRLFPTVPVFLEQLSGHACWVNSKALEIAGADIPAAGDPEGGHVERDDAGQPTGIFSDGAVNLITKHIPPLTDAAADTALSQVLADCASHGLTGVHDLDAHDDDVRLLQHWHDRDELTLRVYAMRDGATGSPSDPFVTTDDGLLTVRGVKFFADGAIGSWSAAMLQGYSDRPEVKGTLVYSKDGFRANVSAWAARGYQVATHAIGDAANRQVLDVYEELLAAQSPTASGGADRRWRVEHAQILSAGDIERFRKLGVIPSMQPTHCSSDLPYAEQRLGVDRASRSYAWMSLLKSGVPVLPFGSDFPTAGTIPPLLGLHAAVTRETPDGAPPGGWFPEQRVTRTQALRGYTRDAAFASFREHELGAIQASYRADLTILDLDVLTVDAPKILDTRVLATIVGGRMAYVANATSTSHGPDISSGASVFALGALAEAGTQNSHRRPGRTPSASRLTWWWHAYVRSSREDAWKLADHQVWV